MSYMVIREIILKVGLRFDADKDTQYEAQERFLESLEAKGMWGARIIEGCVDRDDVPIRTDR